MLGIGIKGRGWGWDIGIFKLTFYVYISLNKWGRDLEPNPLFLISKIGEE